MVVQLSLMMQQESELKRQVIDVGHINILGVHIEDGECLEGDIHVNRCNGGEVVSGQLVGFHVIMDTHFIHVLFRGRVHLM